MDDQLYWFYILLPYSFVHNDNTINNNNKIFVEYKYSYVKIFS